MHLSCLLLLVLLASGASAAPALRVLRTTDSATPLLRNGQFEEAPEGKLSHWRPWQRGHSVDLTGGRRGSQALVCDRLEGGGELGGSQTLVLNRTQVAPLVIRGWSKAENVNGSPDSGYSLYLDLVYSDGAQLWGQTANFSCGTHDWEIREWVLMPDKPVRSVTLHCLFRGHTGKVWFDDVSLEEVPTPAGAALFQGVPIENQPSTAVQPQIAERHLSTADGLILGLRDNRPVSLEIGGRKLPGNSPAGFLARDFASNSDFHDFVKGECQELGLKLRAEFRATNNHIAVTGRITDFTGKDRAITILFALPIEATGWRWGDDMRQDRLIEGAVEFANSVRLPSGANGQMSLYPLGAIWNDQTGVALGLDMDYPAQYRIVYHGGTKQLLIAYDFGLVRETERAPLSADFSFVLYQFDAHWGFRAALQQFHDIFPQHFVKRVQREGNWMPFTDIAKVPGFEDFGFGFQEGAPNVPFDDRHGIASFVYVEPMSHWLAMPPDAPRTYAGALDVLSKDRAGARGKREVEMAAATLSSGIHRADGQFALHIQKAPWCDGGVFLLNPDPGLPVTVELPVTKATVMRQSIDAAFRRNQPSNGSSNSPSAGLDGLYLDSLEMGASDLNYRREHFRTADVPLVFDRNGRPAELLMFATWEFARETAARLHAEGKLMFANAVLSRFSFPAPLFDVMGIEVNWLSRGQYTPDSDVMMNFRRALCRQKPYCLLMNTDYSKFTPDLVEHYFQRCLFYGIWPGFFDEAAASKDPYWASSRQWFERDRALFKRFIPLFQQVTSAGWQPVTNARGDNPRLWLERFGPDSKGALFLTVFNDSLETQTGTVTVDQEALTMGSQVRVEELVSGTVPQRSGRGWQLTLPSQRVAVLCIR